MSYFENTDDCSGSDGHTRLDQLEEAAAARKCRIVEPKSNELFLDIDSEEQAARARAIVMNKKVRKLLGIKTTSVTPSPSGQPGHYHVTVTLYDSVNEERRVFLQAVLGSDPVREILAMQRIEQGIAPVTVFFEKLSEVSQAW